MTGTSLSVSNLMSLVKPYKRLEGIYLWGKRCLAPGMTLYLSFILNDRCNKLPESHPIKLRLSDPNGKVVYQKYKPNELNHYVFW
jgi:hypothetical protein